MLSSQIRQKFLDFYKTRGHAVIPSASLIPENDSSTLFISSGMQPLVPYLLGEKHPDGARLANSQKSFRTEDIEEVGDNRHNTFFEMLGNWSLGDYFKQEQLPWVFEFLTKELRLDARKLYVTVFRGNDSIGIPADNDSAAIWQKIYASAGIEAKDVNFPETNGMQGGRIFYYDEKKNWWSRSGVPANMPVGEPGGPDSEIFYDLGAELKRHEKSKFKDLACHVNCDCGRFIEIGNSVFMEYIRTTDGFSKLPRQNVDFGGGLERITMVSQGLDNIFETDLFINVIKRIERLCGKNYRDNMAAFEIIADHLKAATFIVGDNKGIAPSNTGQGYIARRLLRRAVRYGRQLGITEPIWTNEIAKIIAHDYASHYPELKQNVNQVIEQFKDEEAKFGKTLEMGLKEVQRIVRQKQSQMRFGMAALTDTIKQTSDLYLNLISGKDAFEIYSTYGFPFEMIQEEIIRMSDGVCIIDKNEFNGELAKHQELSRTASAGMFKGGLADSSEAVKKLHTTAHLMLAALRKVLGEHVQQKGSNITAERLRFDFSHAEKMSEAEKQQAEELVNQAISQDLPVTVEEMSLEQAKKSGAIGVFAAKYGDKVKVYTIGQHDNIFSREICGGPHISHTGELGRFKIIKEESSSAGVRRIKAVLE